MAFERIVTRVLPSGRKSRVSPFHISMEGLESATLCREDEDYDQLDMTGELIKKRHSQYLSWKYGEKGLLDRSVVDVRDLDSDWYVRRWPISAAGEPKNGDLPQ